MNFNYLNTDFNILVIDDSKLIRHAIKNTLSQLNMNVDEAVDGIEGLKALQKKKYDLVLVDIIMPNLDGFGFLAKFRDYIADNFIPVILMTGSEDLNSKIKGLRIGADDFLLKPPNEKELIARVLSLLRLKSVHTELYEKNLQIKKELEIAKRVQEFIIPKDFSYIPYPQICGRYLPIEDIGGDYFDCYVLPNNRVGLLIADVTGHGIPAALVMSMSKMMFSIYAQQCNSPSDLLVRVNAAMRGLLLDTQYITTFFIIYDNSRKEITFSNAGHTRALYYRASSNKVLGLDTHGYFIGISDDVGYEEKSLPVNPGDKILLYTDGISELRNNNNEEFGEQRLGRFMREHASVHGDQFCNTLLHTLRQFANLDSRNDDIAFINIEF